MTVHTFMGGSPTQQGGVLCKMGQIRASYVTIITLVLRLPGPFPFPVTPLESRFSYKYIKPQD
jgi:hypothetical protein